MKKLYLIGGIMVVLLALTSVVIYQNKFNQSYIGAEYDDYNLYYQKYENECLTFVKGSNLIEQSEVDTLSVVLYMEYAIRNQSKKEFDELLNFIKEYLMQDDGLIMGKVHHKTEVGAANNAYESIKLMSLLIEAYEKWEDTSYRDLALNIERSLYEHNVKDNQLYSLYNTVTQKTDGQIQLSHLRLKSMLLFAEYRDEWKAVYQESKQLVQKAYISDQLPMYHTLYDTKEGTYITNKTVNMKDSLQIVLNLAEARLIKQETINWIKTTIKEGAICEEYDLVTGKASVHTETPTIYALVAQIGKTLGDNELYTLGIEKMLSFQVKDPEDKMYGAIVQTKEKKVVLYDNIQALLAF